MNNFFGEHAEEIFDNGYEPIPIEPGTKVPKLKGWPSINIDKKLVSQWRLTHPNHSVGIRTKYNPVIDVDITENMENNEVQKLIFTKFNGEAPIRIGKYPKCLFLFRTNRSFKKMRREFFDQNGKKHAVEILGDGQQFVAYGIHPSTGNEYYWNILDEPIHRSADSLPELTEEMAKEILKEIESLLVSMGWCVVGESEFDNNEVTDDPLENFIRPPLDITESQVREVLKQIPKKYADDYDSWLKIGMACHHQFSGEATGLEVWAEFSQQSPKFDELVLNEKWQSFSQSNTDKKITFASVLKSVNNLPIALRLQLQKASELTPEPISWIWDGWLAMGKLHILAGAPGTGKTTIALSMAAIISNGGTWPDGSSCAVSDVLIWSGEDDPQDTLLPRLIAAGADLERVHFVGNTYEAGKMVAFDPARHLGELLKAAERIGNVKLIVCDPIVSAVTGDSHKNTEVRRAMQPLVELGQRLNCAVLGISHFSKGTQGRDPLERVCGSLAFGAVARVVFGAAKLPENEGGGRIFVRMKSNIGADDGGFAYKLEQVALPSYKEIIASKVCWGERLIGSARDLLAESDTKESSALDEAMDFLCKFLADGPKSSREVEQEALSYGISKATLRRARQKLHIKPVKNGFIGGWIWALPGGEEAQASEDVQGFT